MKLFKFHEKWNSLKQLLSEGTDTTFFPLDKEIVQIDCLENIKRGNHKLATKSNAMKQNS